MNKLTPKQQRFIEEYLVDLNATQAAIRAGYSKNGAVTAASRCMANVNILAVLAEKREKLSQDTGITVERVLKGYAKLAFDMPLNETEIRAADKRGALDSIGRHLGMFVDKVEFSGLEGIADRLAKRIKKDGDGAS